MSKELKPCPFCGQEPEVQAWKYNWKLDGFIYDIVCLHCGCSFNASYCETAKEAIAKWNKRAERTCHWIGLEEWKNPVECSECGVLVVAHVAIDSNYCPHCGARVVSEEEQGHQVADAIRRLEKAVER